MNARDKREAGSMRQLPPETTCMGCGSPCHTAFCDACAPPEAVRAADGEWGSHVVRWNGVRLGNGCRTNPLDGRGGKRS